MGSLGKHNEDCSRETRGNSAGLWIAISWLPPRGIRWITGSPPRKPLSTHLWHQPGSGPSSQQGSLAKQCLGPTREENLLEEPCGPGCGLALVDTGTGC